jgi:hypothetical protein
MRLLWITWISVSKVGALVTLLIALGVVLTAGRLLLKPAKAAS